MGEHHKNSALFAEFNPVDAKEWKERMLQDLKGMVFEKLIWKPEAGIDILPFYTSADISDHPWKDRVRELKYSMGWEIRQDIAAGDATRANEIALAALERGATSLGFIIPEGTELTDSYFKNLLDQIRFDCIDLNFSGYADSVNIYNHLYKLSVSNQMDPERITGSLGFDPLGFLSRTGKFFVSEQEDFSEGIDLFKKPSSILPGMKILGTDGSLFHNSGATLVQEIAFSLSVLSDYLDIFSSAGIPPKQISENFCLNLATGPVYFMEIAKIRAARILFEKLALVWGIEDPEARKVFIHCTTSKRNQTLFDPYVNMLRATTESMSAILGGCDSLSVLSYDHSTGQASEFGDRIARNIQIILKEEAWFDKVADPGAGSYFIESLTESIVSEAWKLFLVIEEKGGYLKAFKSGIIQGMISESAALSRKNIETRKEILLGTNQFPDPAEKKPQGLIESKAFYTPENRPGKIAEPLIPFRLSENFEKLRLSSIENKPRVFLLTTGDPVWRKARAGFSAGFFGCAGFDVLDNPGFNSLEEGLKAAINAESDIIVLCSSDEEYASLAPEAYSWLGNRAILVVAGYPKDCIEELKTKGITNFIHLRSDVLNELNRYVQMLKS